MSHTCHVRYVYAWRYDDRHVHILTIVILGGGSCRIAAGVAGRAPPPGVLHEIIGLRQYEIS
eukprot:COSAG01_NODE_35712_length_528_cov_10.109813_1_plen_61_part_10